MKTHLLSAGSPIGARVCRPFAATLVALLLLLPLLDAGIAGAQSAERAAGQILDRAAVRFSVPEGAGRERPYFIYQRQLAFEARLVALADRLHRGTVEPYRPHHLQAAMERHISETLLAAHEMEPPPTAATISAQMQEARAMLIAQVGGEQRLAEAARAEGIDSLELRALYRRRALSSLYLHRMVTPMLEPSLVELRRIHRTGQGPLAEQSFSAAQPLLRREYVAARLRRAVSTYFQNARARLRVRLLSPP